MLNLYGRLKKLSAAEIYLCIKMESFVKRFAFDIKKATGTVAFL